MSHGYGMLHRSSILASVKGCFIRATDNWNSFWYAPADPLMLGIIRLLGGWMVFYNLLIWTLDLQAFFGDHGLQPLDAVRALHQDRFVFSFWLWTGDAYLWPLHILCLTIAGMFCLGIATRVTSVLSFLITISYSQRVPVANFGFDQILGMLCLYLSIGPSGAAVSVDSLVRRWWLRRKGLVDSVRRFSSARIAMRLIQLHLCAIYFWAGFAKLKGPTWWTGEAMWRVIANQEYQTTDLTWMAWVPWLPFLIAHVTIAWEVFFIVLIWNPRLRPLMLTMGLAMHLGIGAFLGMWTFGLIMAFAYLAFSDPDVWRNRLQTAFGKHHGELVARAVDSLPSERISECGNVVVHPSIFNPGGVSVPDDGGSQSANSLVLPTTLPETPVSLQGMFESPRTAGEEHAVRVFSGDSDTVDRVSHGEICIVAACSADRSALRRYFREHQLACRAVSDFDNGLNVLSRTKVWSVVVNGTQFSVPAILDFVADVQDLTDCPVLVLLTSQQASAVSELERLNSVQCLVMPVSLRTIRTRLQNFTQHNSP